MKKLFLLVSLVVLVAIAGQAQKEVVGIPYSFIHNDISLAVDRVDFPAYDLNELLAEDAQKMCSGYGRLLLHVQHPRRRDDACLQRRPQAVDRHLYRRGY